MSPSKNEDVGMAVCVAGGAALAARVPRSEPKNSLTAASPGSAISLPSRLTRDELEVCTMAGIDPEGFIAAKSAGSAIARPSTLTDDDLAVCAMTGISPEEFLASKEALDR